MKTSGYLLTSLLILVFATVAPAAWFVDTETGVAISGYNDARIPGDSGTRFSLSEELRADPAPFYRLRVGDTFLERHTVSFLYAPLTILSAGKIDREVDFNGKTFAADTPLRSSFRFDSYRLTYRYDFYRSEKLEIGAGLTGKIRDAAISLDGAEFTEKKNTGAVPLINFRLNWLFAPNWALLFEGDALAAPQGRAEDVLLAVTPRLNEHLALKIGYRMLEGGADNDEVYTFSLIHYALVGMTAYF
ncbi:MAG: hypothetical protein GX444_19715 [Myxococcales bacterium]|nr:hypothetical protein [Myxococcales bacterium]